MFEEVFEFIFCFFSDVFSFLDEKPVFFLDEDKGVSFFDVEVCTNVCRDCDLSFV